MPVFWLLVILGLFLLWLILSRCFRPIGRFAKRIWGDAQKAMSEDDTRNEDNKEENSTT